jgi:hypothetical protein
LHHAVVEGHAATARLALCLGDLEFQHDVG